MSTINYASRYIDVIDVWPEDTRSWLLSCAQTTTFRPQAALPDELAVFRPTGGRVKLNIDTYDIPSRKLATAFCTDGVKIPGTSYKIRNIDGMFSTCEPADGSEPELPTNWRSSISH